MLVKLIQLFYPWRLCSSLLLIDFHHENSSFELSIKINSCGHENFLRRFKKILLKKNLQASLCFMFPSLFPNFSISSFAIIVYRSIISYEHGHKKSLSGMKEEATKISTHRFSSLSQYVSWICRVHFQIKVPNTSFNSIFSLFPL